MNTSAYHFHIKVKILADFQICISVPFSAAKLNPYVFNLAIIS